MTNPDQDPDARIAAARAVGGLATDAEPAVAKLRQALVNRDPMVRALAAAALGRVGPAAAEAFDDLVLLLDDDVAPVRFWACEALGRLGQAARPALDLLRQRAAEDAHHGVRTTAHAAAQTIEGVTNGRG